ncbi:hypothetical protein TNCV_1366281 [Trichonephila clavipes]|nr:hypothetical protein TNCV_1366281 [Trichonephila clavipes]
MVQNGDLTWSVTKSLRVAEQFDVNIHSLTINEFGVGLRTDVGLDSNKYGISRPSYDGMVILGLSEGGHPKMSWRSTGRSRSTECPPWI